MINLLQKRPILTIIMVVGVMLLPFLDVLEVTIMEARNFVSAREMLTDGNWILTTMNGEPRYEKPPLPTWLSAISASVFGIKSVWGMRFPAVLMVMLLGSMMFTLSRKLMLTKQHSLINGLISVTSLYVVLIIFEAPWDIYAHALMLTGIYFLFTNLKAEKEATTPNDANGLNYLIAALCIGASVLSKGPVSVYALFLPFLISYLLVYRKETPKKRFAGLSLSILMGLLIGFSWYAYVRYADAETFNRVTAKETGNWTSYNVRPFYYYWSFFVQSGLWTIPAFVSLLYPYLKSRVSNLKAYRFTLLWTVFAVLLLSVIPEKKSRYLMPVLIPLALNVGFYLEYLLRSFKEMKDWRELVPVYFNFGLLLLVFTTLPFAILYVVFFEGVAIGFTGILLLLALWAVAIFSLYSLRRRQINVLFYGIIWALVFTVLCGISIYQDNIPNAQLKPFAAVGLERELPFYSLQIDAPEVFWDSGKKITLLGSLQENKLVDDRLYLFVCATCSEVVESDFTAFNSEFISDYDLNFNERDTRAYKARKVGKIYKLTRK